MNLSEARRRRNFIAAAALVAACAGVVSGALAQEVAPAERGAATQAVRQRAAELLAQGSAGEAEDLLRIELEKGRAPALLIALGNVLIERAAALEATSDLGRSLRQGVLEEALSLYAEAVLGPDERVAATIGVASCHVLLGREAEAEAVLRAAVASAGGDAPGLALRRSLRSELIRFLAVRERVEAANEVIAEGRARGDLDPPHVALEQLRIRSVRGERDGLHEAVVAAAVAGAPPAELCYLAWNAADPADYEKKLFLYSALHERFPAELSFRYYRGATRLFMGDPSGALGDLEACLDHPEHGERARVYLGKALLQAGRPDDALPHFEKLLGPSSEVRGDALDGLIGVAVARARERRFADALALYERVLALDPLNYWAHLGRPLCHKSLGDVAGAIAAYEAGLAARPDEPQLLNDFGLVLHAQGERRRARSLFEQALAAGSADGGENLGIFALQDDGDRAAAADYFARTLALDPNRPRVRFYRELCLAELPG
ncbi:MAG: tetratricopeptide repeat protein [Planctomycetes bacterium]|nr:tetratricopeptide repeat protein [Planctomycetota bacterium]